MEIKHGAVSCRKVVQKLGIKKSNNNKNYTITTNIFIDFLGFLNMRQIVISLFWPLFAGIKKSG